MKKSFALFLIVTGLFSSVAFANGSKSWDLADGITFNIDYVTHFQSINDVGGPGGYFAQATVSVSGNKIKDGDQISVVLDDCSRFFEADVDSPNTGCTQVSSQVLVLTSMDNKFSSTAPEYLLIAPTPDAAASTLYFQEVAVVINGKWYKAPTGNNYRFELQPN